MRRLHSPTLTLVLLLAAAAPTCFGQERMDGATTASAINQQLATECPSPSASERCNDEVYLRRATLDVLGRNPSIEEITAFTLDPSPHKRTKLTQRLLDNASYGQNWARYWRDVIMYRRSEDRALISAPTVETYLAEEFNKNTPWDQIASSFITAEGDVRENGATALFMAQQGLPEETTAEVARIFLGIQIQCAQCHDHPTDRWKREQFHQLAAFFPRVAVRPNRDQTKRTFDVVGEDVFRRFGGMNNNNRFRGSAEHHMPDLDNPSAEGKLMTPVFFVTGEQLKLGTKDDDRRESLAKWLTAPKNEWFAKAIVNRLWSELVGEGFYEPVDDLGPDRECHAPKTLELLSQQFVASGHDLKWLFTTILATDAYQRSSAARRNPDEQPFQANVAQRLRSDQLFNNLVAVLEVSDTTSTPDRGMLGLARGPRNIFAAVFGYDPSVRRDEVAGSIPQALAMMNSPVVNGAINARGRTALARLLQEIKDDRALIIEIYLKSVARQPTESEITTCLAYIQNVNNRAEAFEDLQWALINSTEFLHRK